MLDRIIYSKRKVFGIEVPDVLSITIGLIVFCITTLTTITKSSFWFDESFSAYIIRFNFFDIAKYTANDVHPPLYYWFLKPWSMLFGTNELALRSMSVFFGCIALVFGYLLIKRLFNTKAATMSILLMAISPMFVRYGQEARMYTLVAAIALAATYVLTYAVMSKKKLPWLIYGILVSLGMWTHYFTAIVWLAHWVWRASIVRSLTPKGKRFKAFFSKNWILAYIVAVGLYLPWLPFFAYQVAVVQTYGFWIPAVTPETIINYLTNTVYYQDVALVNGWLTAAFISAIVALSFMAVKVYKNLNDEQKKSYKLIMALAFAPVVILFSVSMPPLRSSFIDRYLITSSLGIMMFAAVTITYSTKFLKPKKQTLFTMVLVLLMLVGISNVYYWGNYNKNTHNWNGTRQIIEAVNLKSSTNEPIIINSPYLFYEAICYANDRNPVYFIEPDKYQYGSTDMLKYNDQFKIKKSNGRIDSFTNKNSKLWYIGWSNDGKLDAPYSNWEPIQEISITDKFSGKPAYKAIEFQVVNK